MRARCRLSPIIAATLLAAAGCAPPAFDDGAAAEGESGHPGAAQEPAAVPTLHRDQTAEFALCTVLPQDLVGELADAQILDAAGDGMQCTWRLDTPSPAGSRGTGAELADDPDDGTMQAAFVDRSAFDAGRPPEGDPAAVTEIAGLGDEAFVVHLGAAAPSTLYARDGDRALSLWLQNGARDPQDTERSLTRVAALLLDLA